MISKAAKTLWGVAVVAALGSTAYWIQSSDPVRKAELALLRESAAEADKLAAANHGLEAALPTDDLDSLKSVNSELLKVRNQSLATTREIAALEKTIETVRVEETPEMTQLAAQNKQLSDMANQANLLRAQQEAAAQKLAAQAEQSPDGQPLAAPGGRSAAYQLINRLRSPDGTLTEEAKKAATDALQSYRDTHNGANAATVEELLPMIPQELLREDSQEVFEVISRGPNGEVRTPGSTFQRRRR